MAQSTSSTETSIIHTRGLGMLQAACIGDAVGKFLESKKQPTLNQIDKAFAFQNGGPNKLDWSGPEVSDDGALCMIILMTKICSFCHLNHLAAF